MKRYSLPQKKKNYAPSQTVINELTDLISIGITNISHQSIRNSKFYKEIQTATTLLIFNDRTVPPKVLLLIAQIAETSPTLYAVRMYGKNFGESGGAIAEALAKSHTIYSVIISYQLVEHGPEIAKAFTKSPTIGFVNMNGRNLTEQTTNIFAKHNDEYFGALSKIAQNLNLFMPKPVINTIGSYLTSFIKYSINGHVDGNYKCSMHGNYTCDLSSHNWHVKKFKDGQDGYIWRPVIVHEGRHSNKHLIEHTRSNEKKSAPVETTNTNSTSLDTTVSESTRGGSVASVVHEFGI